MYDEDSKAEYLRTLVESLRPQTFRSLSFDLILLSTPPSNTFDHYSLGIMTGVLQVVKWCSIQHISLSFVLSEWESVNCVDWGDLDVILTQPHFDKAKRIRISVYRVDEERDRALLVNAVTNALPRLQARGVLTFDFCEQMEGTYY